MTDSIPAETVIRIDPDGKYIMVFPMRLTEDEFHKFRQQIDDWMVGDAQFLLVDGGVRIIKMERYGAEEETKAEAEAEAT